MRQKKISESLTIRVFLITAFLYSLLELSPLDLLHGSLPAPILL